MRSDEALSPVDLGDTRDTGDTGDCLASAASADAAPNRASCAAAIPQHWNSVVKAK